MAYLTRCFLLLGTILGVSCGLIIPITALQAKQPNSYVYLDEATITKGYTNQLGRLQVGIQPNTFTTAAGFLIRRKKAYADIPTYLKLVSPVYLYRIDTTDGNYIEKPLWLSYQYKKDSKKQRSFYYYDGISEWVKLPTTIDTSTNQLSAAWHFPYSIVAVMDDKRYRIGPTPTTSFADFGTTAAVSAIAIDDTSGNVLYEQNADAIRSIASLTKLMTAYVLLQNNVNLDAEVEYHTRYDQAGARLRMSEGDILSMRDLLYAMTVGSANNAAYALVDQAGFSTSQFVTMMNEAAADLDLGHTTFADPSGLDPNNVSTASDYAKFMRSIMRDPDMLALTTAKSYSFTTRNTGEYHDFNNTNSLMRTSDLYITGSKTGYLDEAGYCLAIKAKADDHEVITVVLGSTTSSARFSESERLMKWAFANYEW